MYLEGSLGVKTAWGLHERPGLSLSHHTVSVASNQGSDGARRARVRGETEGLWEKGKSVEQRGAPEREAASPSSCPRCVWPPFPGAGLHSAVDICGSVGPKTQAFPSPLWSLEFRRGWASRAPSGAPSGVHEPRLAQRPTPPLCTPWLSTRDTRAGVDQIKALKGR